MRTGHPIRGARTSPNEASSADEISDCERGHMQFNAHLQGYLRIAHNLPFRSEDNMQIQYFVKVLG